MGLKFLFNRPRRFVAVVGLTLAAASAQPASSAPLSITYNTEFAFDAEYSTVEGPISEVHDYPLETFPAGPDDLSRHFDRSWLEGVSVSHEIRATATFTWTSNQASRFGLGTSIDFTLWTDGIAGQH